MSVLSRLAFRYAQAFLNTYPQALAYNEVKRIEQAGKALAKQVRLLSYLKVPLEQSPRLIEAVYGFLKKHQVTVGLEKMVNLLVSQDRLVLLPSVLEAIAVEYRKRHRIVACTVSSAYSLSDKQKSHVEQVVAQRFQVTPEVTYTIDKDLVAGIRVQAGYLLWEYSVAQQMRYVSNALVEVYSGH